VKTLLSPPPGAARTLPSGVLVVDKPRDWTSHDVVMKVRRLLKTRKVGHTGTLDPLGTGVLPICVGDATKLAGFAQAADKVYRMTMRLGVATDTQDSMGLVTHTTPLAEDVDWEGRIRKELDALAGTHWQTPPMYAAVKVGGEPLYRKARRGETVERTPRRVTIYSVRDVEVSLPDVTFTLACAKGTYVRTVAADLGQALGVGAHLTALRRLACGAVTLAEAVTIEALERMAAEGRLEGVLQPDDHLIREMPRVTVSEYTARRMLQGISPHVSEWPGADVDTGAPAGPPAPGTLCRVYGEKRGFFALVEITANPVQPGRIRRIIKTQPGIVT
jgi:tRNA pseudouridine55 synthase